MKMGAAERLEYKSSDFKFIQKVMHQHAGINLNDGKKELVYSRLAKRVRGLGLRNFREYCSVLETNKFEVHNCINSMTTNVTSFFRENHHFDFLKSDVLPQAKGAPLRIWSAGCSTGEEPYSIATTCQSVGALNTEIVATDLDSEVVRRAQAGIYRTKDVADLNERQLKKWFLRGTGNRCGSVKVVEPIQKMVKFSQLNLKDEWKHSQPFDVIFCRNVMIYFDNEFRSNLLARFSDCLKPGGYLILGHSESMFGLSDKFKVVGKTIHQKIRD